jgi:hypothetical protein
MGGGPDAVTRAEECRLCFLVGWTPGRAVPGVTVAKVEIVGLGFKMIVCMTVKQISPVNAREEPTRASGAWRKRSPSSRMQNEP